MKKALLLLNMGGANNIDEVEIFLKNMFNDKNILTIRNRFLRKFVAFMIIKKRLKESQSNYKLIGGKSPLPEYTRKLVEKLQKSLKDYDVLYAMSYTPPFLKDSIKKEYDEVTVLPLFAQYSTTTTLTSIEQCEEFFSKTKLKIIDRFYKNRLYNLAIVERILETLGNSSAKDFDLIFSAHGLPKKIVEKGDPYQKEIKANVYILRKMLIEKNIHFNKTHIAYQSKVGPMEWLTPSLEDKLHSLKNKNVIIYPISFIIDNSETEFELEIEYKEIADELGLNYRVAKCLNDSNTFIKAIEEIIKKI